MTLFTRKRKQGSKQMKLLSGNEASACGAKDAGATIGVGYPGTPSTEALETYAKLDGVYAEWCTNEKVALEVAIGASAGGARCFVTMKHVGVNVAADPLFTAAYTGVNGGLVVFAADDPGMHSSQNEQDTHYYGASAHIPVLDPSNSQEAYDFMRAAFDISEEFDVPVIVRSTVRVSHTKTPVEQKPAFDFQQKAYEKDPSKWVMMPLYAKPKRVSQLERIQRLEKWANETPLNTLELKGGDFGVVCFGAVYEYVREALPEASILKLGVSYPLPDQLISELNSNVEKLYVIEEASTYLYEHVKALGFVVSKTPSSLTLAGELSPVLIKKAFSKDLNEAYEAPENLPARPPALCAGCPHRVVFKELSRLKAIVTGDIGCYTLGALPPLASIDTCIDMGASVSMSHGMELAMRGTDHRPIVGIIGDSTFAHSGLSSLISTFYNNGSGTICILDNRTTAMTGRQGNPFNGVTIQGRTSNELDIQKLVEAIGVRDVETLDPYDVKATREALKRATSNIEELSVLIFKHPCILLDRTRNEPYHISQCTGCGVCLSLGCPSIGKDLETGLSYIDTGSCIGCGQCAQYCRFDAIVR